MLQRLLAFRGGEELLIIKMTNDKELVVTIKTTIYRGESRADLITFLIPMEYENQNMANCAMVMRYVLPDGSGKSESLSYLPEPYKNYLQFSTVVNTRLTAQEGEVTIWLTAFDNNDSVVLKTGEAIIDIEPSKDITDYMRDEDLDQLDALSAKVVKLESGVAELSAESADNLVYDATAKTLQLSNDGELIGDPVDMSKVVPDNESDPSADGSEGDKIIYF